MKKYIIFIFALAAMVSCKGGSAQTVVSFDDIIASRRSIRDFDPARTISEAEVRAIIEASQEAPSWTNSQPTRYYVALSAGKVDAVRDLIGERNKRNTAGAGVFVISTFVNGQSGFFRGIPSNEVGEGWGAYDNGLSNAYFILKARAMGFDTLIMGARDADALRTLFNIPQEETLMAVIALGYRASSPNRPPRKPLDEIVSFF